MKKLPNARQSQIIKIALVYEHMKFNQAAANFLEKKNITGYDEAVARRDEIESVIEDLFSAPVAAPLQAYMDAADKLTPVTEAV